MKWIVRVGVALWIAAIAYRMPGVNYYGRATLGDMVYGRAWRPYVTRALFPATVRALVRLIPPGLGSAVSETRLGVQMAGALSRHKELERHRPFLREYLAAYVLSVACLVLLSLTMERLWEAMFSPAVPHGYAFSIIGLLGLPTCFSYCSYIYDFPTLWLYTTGLLLMARRRWAWYGMVFILACVNKETAILLTLVFALYFARSAKTDRAWYGAALASQVAGWAAVRGALGWVFRNNPGSQVEFHLFDHNVGLLMQPWARPAFVVWGLLVVLFFHDFGRKPLLLRVASGMVVPLLALSLLFGYVDEWRGYYEVYVPAAALIGYSVCVLLGCRIETTAPDTMASVRGLRSAAGA